MTMVTSSSVAGAEMMTFLAPASRCLRASAALVKKPVDSITTSTPSAPQGRLAAPLSARLFIGLAPTVVPPGTPSTLWPSRPSTLSYFSRCAIVATSPRSFAATISMSAPDAATARKKLRPIRPKPLIPTRTVTASTPRQRLTGWDAGRGTAPGLRKAYRVAPVALTVRRPHRRRGVRHADPAQGRVPDPRHVRSRGVRALRHQAGHRAERDGGDRGQGRQRPGVDRERGAALPLRPGPDVGADRPHLRRPPALDHRVDDGRGDHHRAAEAGHPGAGGLQGG